MTASVLLYVTKTCPFCTMAKALLDQKNISYEVIDVSDPEDRAALVQKAGGRKTVPQIFIHGTPIGGYDDLSALNHSGALDTMISGEQA